MTSCSCFGDTVVVIEGAGIDPEGNKKLIDWIEFYAVSAIFQPCNGGNKTLSIFADGTTGHRGSQLVGRHGAVSPLLWSDLVFGSAEEAPVVFRLGIPISNESECFFEGHLSYYSMKNHSKRPYLKKIYTEVGAYEKYDEIIC